MGKLLYIATRTRPDIAYTVIYASQFNTNYDEQHVLAVKHCFRYLKGTSDYKLQYKIPAKCNNEIQVYCDADYGNVPDSKSFTGSLFMFNGCLIHWICMKTKSVATSTTHAECLAADLATRELIWYRDLLAEIGYPQKRPSTVHCDCQPAIDAVTKPGFNKRTKHFNTVIQFLKEQLELKRITFFKIDTSKQLADFLTKGITTAKLEEFLLKINLAAA